MNPTILVWEWGFEMSIKFIGPVERFDNLLSTSKVDIQHSQWAGSMYRRIAECRRYYLTADAAVAPFHIAGCPVLVMPVSMGKNMVLARNTYGWVDVTNIEESEILDVVSVGAPADTFTFLVSTLGDDARRQAAVAERQAVERQAERQLSEAVGFGAGQQAGAALRRLFR